MKLDGPIIIVSAILFYVCYLVLDNVFGGGAIEEKKIQARLKNLIQIKRESAFKRTRVSSIAMINDIMGESKLLLKIEELLRIAKIDITPMTFILLVLILFFSGLWVGGIIAQNMDLGFFFGVIAASLPIGILFFMKGQYTAKFMFAFPDALSMMKNSVRAGQGIQSAFRTIAEEGPYPVSVEFARIIKEIEMGGHLDEAINGLYKRLKTRDIRLFALGILIQNELGGNIGDLFENIAKTIRERITSIREMKALTSQAKASAIILILLPVGIFMAVNMLNPGYFDEFFKSPFGRQLFVFGFVWLGIGAVIIFKMTEGAPINS